MSATTTERWQRVTKRNPCPICEHDGYCMISPDGAIAGCMRVQPGSFKTAPTNNGDMYLHDLTDEPREPRPARPQPTDAPQRDVIADRAVFASVIADGRDLPAIAVAELARRFGSDHAPWIAEHFGIAYCDGPATAAKLEGEGRRREAIAAGVLWRNGKISPALDGHLLLPYTYRGVVLDVRSSGIKGCADTKEISLPGGYAEREVDGLFSNHDALDNLPEDGTVHMAGGFWKMAALARAGLCAVGTRGEAELSDAQIATLQAAGVQRVIEHIDAEDAKEGQALSAGRRLGLQRAEKLATVGFAVEIAEPPREPGTPKVDPDALLRDLGPRAVRDYALSAIPLDAWRVVIGVVSPGVPEEFAARLDYLEQERRKANRTLSGVIQIRRNGAIKAEGATLTASVLHMRAEQANQRTTPAGRIRQPLYVIAQAAGTTNKTASGHLRLGPENDLFDREVLKEVIIREVDPETGERHETLRLINDRKEIVEECPVEAVFGPTGAPPDQHDGAYYVTPRHEPEVILERLVTLAPVKTKKNGEVKEQWGGKREPCPVCKSERRVFTEACADCGHEFHRKVSEPVPEMETVADISARTDEPASIPPTPVEELAADPLDTLDEVRLSSDADDAEPADDWDPYQCNHRDHRGQQCTARIDPALGKRYCWQHRRVTPAPVAVAPPGDTIPEPPNEAFVWPEGLVAESVETPRGVVERIRRAR